MKKRLGEKYKAVIFDLDGTLINSLPYHVLSFKDLLLERGVRVDDNYLKKLIGLPTEVILKELEHKYRIKENIHNLREERRYHYFKFLGKRDITFPGVKKFLGELRLDYKLAVATGSSKVILIHSTDKDFQGLFDVVVTINEVKKGKPSPEQLFLAVKRLKVKKQECLFIGDSIYDAIASKTAGIDFIGVTTGYIQSKEFKENSVIKVLSSVKELKKIL